MRKNIIYIAIISFLILFSHQQLFAQDTDTNTSNESQEIITETNHSIQEENQPKVKKKFTTYFSSRTTYLNSIGIGFGDQFNLWYYYMAPWISLERIDYISFGFGFGGKGVGYVTYKENGDMIDHNDNSYFFFLGGSVGFTFFITDRIFLHPAVGVEYWFGDTHSGANYTYEYEDGFNHAGGFKSMFSIGLFSLIPVSDHSTTSIGLAYNYNGYQYKSFNIIFTFY